MFMVIISEDAKKRLNHAARELDEFPERLIANIVEEKLLYLYRNRKDDPAKERG